jgi:SLBB domain
MKFLSTMVHVLCLAMAMAPFQAHAASSGITFSKEIMGSPKGSEYVSGDYPGAVMMKINLWGSVNKPGIHYVPAKTDLSTLLSYAGGPMEKAILDDVIIKRTIGGTQTVMHVDMEEVLNKADKKPPILEANDTVLVNAHQPIFSDNSMQVISVVASSLAMILAVIAINKTTQK